MNWFNVYKENRRLKLALDGATNKIAVLEAAVEKHISVVKPIVDKRAGK